MSSSVTLREFTEYVQCKAFDVISGDGSYKRHVYQCVENEEPWALSMHASVSKVTHVVRELQATVERVRALNNKLSRVLTEVVTSMHAPVRVVSGLSICCLTDTQTRGCIDVSRATKTDSPVTVHVRFHYFVLMLYYAHRLEHVVRSLTKSWLEAQEAEVSIAHLVERFGAQRELFAALHTRFTEGLEHVQQSLEHFLCSEVQ